MVILLDHGDTKTGFGEPCRAGNASGTGTWRRKSVCSKDRVSVQYVLTYDYGTFWLVHASNVVLRLYEDSKTRAMGVNLTTGFTFRSCMVKVDDSMTFSTEALGRHYFGGCFSIMIRAQHSI